MFWKRNQGVPLDDLYREIDALQQERQEHTNTYASRICEMAERRGMNGHTRKALAKAFVVGLRSNRIYGVSAPLVPASSTITKAELLQFVWDIRTQANDIKRRRKRQKERQKEPAGAESDRSSVSTIKGYRSLDDLNTSNGASNLQDPVT